jgi:hypothetical protein
LYLAERVIQASRDPRAGLVLSPKPWVVFDFATHKRNDERPQLLTLPPAATGIGFLRRLPRFERISYRETPNNYSHPAQTSAEFWEEYDTKK